VDLAPIMPGRLRAHVVERQTKLLLETTGGTMGVVHLAPRDVVARFEAADGSWDVQQVERVVRHVKPHYAVDDEDGITVATVWPAGGHMRIDVPAGSVEWQAPSLLQGRPWNYQVEGLLVARPSWTTLGNGHPGKRPFTVEVTPALVARPDAALVLLIAAWLTWERVNVKGE
jgi:hypothetical protein